MVTRNNIHRPKFNLQKLGRVRKQALKSNATSYKSTVSTDIQHVRRISKKKAQQKGKQQNHMLESALIKAGGVREATMKEAPIEKEQVVVKKAVPSGSGTTLGAPSGAQPVSFTRNTLTELRSEDYFVSEKSDGVRVLLYCVLHQNGQQQVFLVDRKNKFSYVPQLRFPVLNPAPGENPYHNDTIVDGELVTDREPNGQVVVRYLAFDLLAYRGNNILAKPLTSRLARLQNEFVGPYREMLRKASPEFINSQPFKVSLKEMQLSYGIEKMFREVIPNLKHGSDGLIFTSAIAPYVPSTNTKMLKWKPPSENTVDFKLTLEFRNQNGAQNSPQKPQFLLFEWKGGQDYAPFGQMIVDDDQWERWFTLKKTSGVRGKSDRIGRARVRKARHNAVYHVGDQIDVRISIVGGTSGALYRANPEITILLQKDIRLPALNVQVGKIRARELFHNGFRFRVKSRYLIREQANVPYRVRTSFDLGRHSGFADSASFRLVRNSHPGNNGH
ncbi:Dcp1p-Dcp2p decapping enzyme complex alpha subunit [Dissophora globulifera]|uniref:mRNA guanylyltransferase n=1 Tax=Dissophora globulifera TaxID=979702 RepID=A0A9P6RT47_9FUNG|nr:Dcp1p-Dcp2p decapping enzyme complex alpha subunit [Dissophora globulifera]